MRCVLQETWRERQDIPAPCQSVPALGHVGQGKTGTGIPVSHSPGERPQCLAFGYSGMTSYLVSLGQKLHPRAEKLSPVKVMLKLMYLTKCILAIFWLFFFFN